MSGSSQERVKPNDQKALFKHTKNYFTASAITSVIASLNFLIITYFLTLEEYGYLSIFNTLVTVFTIIYLLNTHSGVARLQLDERDDWDVLLGSNLLFVCLWIGLLSIGLSSWSRELYTYFAIPPAVFYWAMIVSALQCTYQYLMIYLSTDQQSERYSKLSVYKRLFSVVGSISLIIMFTDERYLGKVYAEVAVGTFFGLYCAYALYRLASFRVFGSPWRSYLGESLRYALPLIPHTLSRYILGYFDQLQINQISGGADTGRYAFAANVAIFMGFIVTAAGKAWHPIFIDLYQRGQYSEIERLVQPHARRIFLVACVISLYAGDVIYLIVPAQYHAGVPLIPIILLGYVCVFLYTLYFQYSSYRKRTELISIATLLAGTLNIALNAYFIPTYGYQAAAYTTFFSYFTLLSLHYINARFILRAHVLEWRNLAPNVSFVTIVTLCASYLYTLSISQHYLLIYGVKLTLTAGCVYLFTTWLRPDRAHLEEDS